MGWGGIERQRLQTEAKRRGLQNIVFLPRREPENMPPIFALSDVLLVHLKEDPLFCITIPSKTQAYLAFGKPILMAVRGDAADLVASWERPSIRKSRYVLVQYARYRAFGDGAARA